jgi:drug/metabolite transporter (DMT)-like permease
VGPRAAHDVHLQRRRRRGRLQRVRRGHDRHDRRLRGGDGLPVGSGSERGLAPRTAGLVAAALAAFASNSLLARAAIGAGRADPAAFTALRLASGAAALALLARLAPRAGGGAGAAPAARPGALARGAALAAYALLFSFAYARVSAGVGALVLFACVQATMLAAAVRAGEGPRGVGWLGVALGLGGLALLTLPGADAPDALGAAWMAGAGVAWGLYSLLGRGSAAPLAETAGAFLVAAPAGLVALGIGFAAGTAHADAAGVALGTASGAVASGLGYVVWYAALPRIGAARAAVVQLLVPVLAAAGGAALLSEAPGARLAVSAALVLGGVALTGRGRPRTR